MLTVKCSHCIRQNVDPNCRVAGDVHSPGAEFGDGLHRLLRVADHRQNATGAVMERLPDCGEDGCTAAGIEQRPADCSGKCLHLISHRRLGQRECLRRAREAPVLDHAREDSERIEAADIYKSRWFTEAPDADASAG